MKEMFRPEHYKEVGTFFRFTTNLRNVNAKTEPYYFPLPDVTDVYHYTRGSRYYSSVDFRDAFFTVELAEEDRDKPHSLPHMEDSNEESFHKEW